MNEQIARNKRRTFYMLLGFVAVITLAATAIVLLFGGGWVGVIIAFVLAMALAWGSYYNSDKIAIAASRAKPADETEFRRYHNLVEGLCIAAGLPKPRLYVVDDPSPNIAKHTLPMPQMSSPSGKPEQPTTEHMREAGTSKTQSPRP